MDGGGLSDFLRACRGRVRPEQAGLRRDERQRRVPGLRREELAQLAGVSVDYYMRLEQGRTTNVSDSVLDAVSRVLGLTADEREHLKNLAHPVRTPSRPRERAIDEALSRLLDMMSGIPSMLLGRSMDLLAWNTLAGAVFDLESATFAEHNIARAAFLKSEARTRYPNWDSVAAEAVAYLHLQSGRYPDDSNLIQLIDELSQKSDPFRALWADQVVRERTITTVWVQHAIVGRLEFTNVWLAPPAWPDLTLVAYTVQQGSLSEERLRILADRTPAPFEHVVADHA